MRGNQGALAGIGHAHQRHVGQQLELEIEPELLALLALLGESRSPAPVGKEAGIALPPRPPWAASQRSPAAARSARTVPSADRTVVPTGTGTSRSAPAAPWRFLPDPWRPSPARRWGWSRNPSSEAWFVVVTSQMSPPWPPSPPSGPPWDTCASRRTDTAPAPPSPAFTWSWASSTNPGTSRSYVGGCGKPSDEDDGHDPLANQKASRMDALGVRCRSSRRPACVPCANRT